MGQTKNTGCCEGLMCKNGEHNVVDFVCAKGRRVDIYAGGVRATLLTQGENST
jgi:hypothetical protein